MHELRISIAGDRIEMAAVRDALADLLKLLRSVQAQVARGQGIRWRLATLSYSSPVVIGCVGEVRSKRRRTVDPSVVVHTIVSGLAELEQGARPKDFSDDALEVSKRLAAQKGRRGVREVLVMEENGAAPTPLTLSARTLAAVEDLIGVKSESLGSVEGRLEVISAHGGISCNVYESLTNKPVKCDVPEKLKRAVLDAFERRVIASGIVRRDASGQARQIALQDLEVLAADAGRYVSLAGIAPDFTDGVESAQYIKERWK